MYGGMIQQVGMPGQMANPEMYAQPTIIYGDGSQRYDYQGAGPGQYDQAA